jgi:NADH:ubiquinone oxidoreductase subunit F (NADH-binding)
MLDDHPYFKKQVKYVLRTAASSIPNPWKNTGERRFQGLDKALSMTRRKSSTKCSNQASGEGAAPDSHGKKWEFAWMNKSEKKYVVCNADEGDPARSWTARSWRAIRFPSSRA